MDEYWVILKVGYLKLKRLFLNRLFLEGINLVDFFKKFFCFINGNIYLLFLD